MYMSETTTEETAKTEKAEVEVLVEQVEKTVTDLKDIEEHALASYKTAYDATLVTLAKLQAAAAAATDPAVKDVLTRAIGKAQELITEMRAVGKEASLKVATMQGELQALVDQIKLLDPSNALVQDF